MARKKTANNLVIENTQARAIFLPPARAKDGPVHPLARKGRMLYPGQNDVPAEHWDAIQTNPSVKLWGPAGMRYLVSHGPGKAAPVPRGLDGMDERDALAKLELMNDVPKLVELRDLTTSAALRDLANARITELTAPSDESDTEA